MREEDKLAYDPVKGKISDREWLLDTEGTNMLEVMTVPGVDHTRTISNDVVEVLGVLGIEGCRVALLRVRPWVILPLPSLCAVVVSRPDAEEGTVMDACGVGVAQSH